MTTFSVTHLGRDSNGRFKREYDKIAAEDTREVIAWVLHEASNGRRCIESDIEVHNQRTGDQATYAEPL